MDIARTRQLLDSIPARSDYEFRNFEIESQGSWHRQMRYVLSQKELLADEIEIALAKIDLSTHQVSQIKDKTEQAIRKRISDAEINVINRNLTDLRQKIAQIDAYLATYDDSELEDIARGFEQSESDHWAELLGREVGVEVLSDKQASKHSLMQLSLLPLADYKKSVIITNQFATFLKKTAEQAEHSIAGNRPASMPTQAPEPKAEIAADAVAEMAKIRDTVVEASIAPAAVMPADDADKKKKKKKKK
jgi:hypothetical protein